MHLFFSVGEPSGDQHAAHLMRELKQRHPDVRISGFGGPMMEQEGLQSLYRLTNLAVMGIFRVLPLLWTFYQLVRRANRFIQTEKPDAVVLIDFPGFNWWIARKAKAAGVPVYYYLPPQMWAWAPWRIGKIRRFVDHVLSGLPFEPQWYADRGVKIEYVGHPFFDEVADHRLDGRFVETWSHHRGPVVALLPGSRNQEVSRNWPTMVNVIRRLHEQHPDVVFLVANYRETHRRRCLKHLLKHAPTLPVQFFTGRTPEIIEAADCALMVSGSVSLEMVARQTPAVVMYRLLSLPNLLRRWFILCRFISLPNLIAGRELMPEFIYSRPKSVEPKLAAVLHHWLEDPSNRQAATQELSIATAQFRQTGATIRTAEYILRTLSAGERIPEAAMQMPPDVNSEQAIRAA